MKTEPNLIKKVQMSRYNSSNCYESSESQAAFLDFSRPKVAEFEEDLLAHYFTDVTDLKQPEDFEIMFVDNTTYLEKFSILSSRGTTTLSTHSSESSSSACESEMDHSHKLTEATKDTSNYQPQYEFPAEIKYQEIEREIFLISKLTKRAPRRSFDLGELTQGQEIVFEDAEPKVFTPASSMCVDKEKLANLYNKMVDEGRCIYDWVRKLNSTEIQIMEIMLKLRLTLTKVIKETHSTPLLSNLDELNEYLSRSTFLKKRSEELLKKNFKTVLKTLLEKERKLLPKGTSALDSRILFTNKFFGTKARDYDKIFKCIQMSQEYYTGIFKFADFRQAFSTALSTFMEQFLVDRISKTENLITQIKSDFISGNSIKPNLRTPWSIKEGEASMKLMSQFL